VPVSLGVGRTSGELIGEKDEDKIEEIEVFQSYHDWQEGGLG